MPKGWRLVGCLLLAGCTVSPAAPIHYQEAVATRVSLTRSTQIQLIRLGYFNDTPDGYYNAKTQNAISNFQEANGLIMDGTPSWSLLATLTAATAVVNAPVVVAPPSDWVAPSGSALQPAAQPAKT